MILQMTVCEKQDLGERHSFGRTSLDAPLILFLISAFIGFWVSYDHSLSWSTLVTLVISAILFLVMTRLSLGTSGLRRLAWILLLIQGALALYFITQFKHLGYPVKMVFISRLGRFSGSLFPSIGEFYPHPNAVATFIEGGLPLSAGLWLSARKRQERLLAGLSLALLGYGLFLTASRGAWVAVATCTGLSLMTWIVHRFFRRWQGLALVALITLVLVTGAGLMCIGSDHVPGLNSALWRAANRADLYKNSLHLIRDYPLLGIGLGDTFGLVYSKYILLIPHVFLTYPHNLILAVWLNQGLLGLLSFVWLLVAFYRPVVGLARRAQGTPVFWGAVLGVTAILLHGTTDAPQYSDDRWTMPMLFALLVLSVVAAPPSSILQHSPFSIRRMVPKALLTIGLGLAAAFLLADIAYTNLGTLRHTRADLASSEDDAAREQNLAEAACYYRRALEIDRAQPVAHWRLGLIALNGGQFSQAVAHLEIARSALPGHRGVQKALGYAYLWDGQVERAEPLLAPLSEVPGELESWSWWYGRQGQEQLSEYARELLALLSQDR